MPTFRPKGAAAELSMVSVFAGSVVAMSRLGKTPYAAEEQYQQDIAGGGIERCQAAASPLHHVHRDQRPNPATGQHKPTGCVQ